MTALLTVESLSKSFRTRHGVVRAVDNVSFEVGGGETVALVGESGCGKTTVALALLRLIESDGGRVLFEGADLSQAGRAGEQAWRQRLSIVFQNPYSSLDPRMRIRDIVGGRSATYDRELRRARELALDEMKTAAAEIGANAVVAVDLDYETVGTNGSMLMVTVSGTAVVVQ